MGCAGLKTYGYLECWSADILLGRDIATQLKPDVILVAVHTNCIGCIHVELHCPKPFRCGREYLASEA